MSGPSSKYTKTESRLMSAMQIIAPNPSNKALPNCAAQQRKRKVARITSTPSDTDLVNDGESAAGGGAGDGGGVLLVSSTSRHSPLSDSAGEGGADGVPLLSSSSFCCWFDRNDSRKYCFDWNK